MHRMSGIEALMKVLDAHEVEYIFGNPGSTEAVFMDALYQHPRIKYILALHETVAAGMAEGYAWASGKAAVVNVHTLPGLANLISTLYNASKADMNMVVTAGQQDTRLIQQEPGLTGDLVRITAPYTKWSTEVYHAEDIPLVMHRAFKLAAHQPQGPVFVSLPQDVLQQEGEIDVGRPHHVTKASLPDPASIEAAAEILSHAQNPALFVGFRLARANALREVVEMAQLIGARVIENRVRAETAFPTTHPLFQGPVVTDTPDAPQVLKDTDVILVVGANFISQFFHVPESLVPATTKVIHLDVDPWEVGKNYPTDVGIVGDIKTGLQELIETTAKRMSAQAKNTAEERGKCVAAENQRRREVLWERAQQEWDREPIAESRLFIDLKEVLPKDAIIVDGGVTASRTLRAYMDFDDASSYIALRDNAGTMGDSLPMALGVKLGQPERPVVGVVGDGNAMYSIQGLWTAAHHQIPVTYVICSNATYKVLKLNTIRVLGQESNQRFHSLDLTDPPLNFAGLAQAFGIHGEEVRKPSEIKPALERALALGEPALVDVHIDGGY